MKKITKTLVAMLLAIAPLAGSAQGVDQYQEIMGYDTTNVINGWDANREDTVRVGAVFSPLALENYVGGHVIGLQIGLNKRARVSRIFAQNYYELQPGYNDDAYTEPEDSIDAGWSTILFDQPLDIIKDRHIIVGYEIITHPGDSVIGVGTVTNPYGLMIHTDNGYGYKTWLGVGDAEGNPLPCLQVRAIIDYSNLPDADLAIEGFHINEYHKSGGKMPWTIVLHEKGKNDVTSYAIDEYIDNERVDTYNGERTIKTFETDTVTTSLQLPELSSGTHTLKLVIYKVNGQDPVGDTDDDALQADFQVYQRATTRKKALIENFTSSGSGLAVLGNNAFASYLSTNNDVVLAQIHYDRSSKTDPLTIEAGTDLYNYLGAPYSPSASYNRCSFYRDGSILQSSNYLLEGDELTEYIQEQVDYANQMPAFADVDMSANTTANADGSATVSLNVNGGILYELTDVCPNPALTVYLLQDSVVSEQDSTDVATFQSTTLYNYVHNNVLRAVISSTAGDAISASAGTFSKDYTYTIPASLLNGTNINKFRIVAFVASQLSSNVDLNNAHVNNANAVSLAYGSVTGIKGVENADANAQKVVARYNLAGQRVGNNARGVTIVRYADGRIVKSSK